MEYHEDNEEKKIRHALRNRKPEDVLKQDESSNLERKIASKVIIENIFQDKFGVTIQSFQAQNTKQQAPKKASLNIANLEEMLNSLSNSKSGQSKDIVEKFNLQKNIEKDKRDTENESSVSKIDLQERNSILNRIRNSYQRSFLKKLRFETLSSGTFRAL